MAKLLKRNYSPTQMSTSDSHAMHDKKPVYCHGESVNHFPAPNIIKNTSNCEPVAIIGLASKFPQKATDTEAFWNLLLTKQSALSKVPEERYNASAFVSWFKAFLPALFSTNSASYRVLQVRAISSVKTWVPSTPRFSVYHRPKQRTWIHNSGGC